ncbi:capsular polysaccharide biosynthesis protein [Orrella sp. JC864]|uniref:capsular polysaccharide biosynthesis protein n=1 Tax=Orrella sp. JC864 TaxID=3120298 RepID=UPI003008F2B7
MAFRSEREPARRWAVVSRGVRAVATLPALLAGQAQLVRTGRPARAGCEAVLAWGCKPSARRAQALARREGLALIRLEDGFLRSVGLGNAEPPLSVVVDDLGIYYDAGRASRLERLIAAPLAPAQAERARALCERWRAQRVSKYNHAPEPDALPADFVLVADQTAGDLSIGCGQASAESFARMLQAALAEHPDAQIVLKVHPDVIDGRKRGHFDLAALRGHPRVQVLARDVHACALLQAARAVYVVTSQLGFEALLWGKPVRVFGMPFYAGWGLTGDALAAPARRGRASLEQLVHAALVEYPRYLHPETGQPCTPEALIDWMGLQRRQRARLPAQAWAYGFSRWKRPLVRRFLDGARLRFVRRLGAVPPGGPLVLWGRRHDARWARRGAPGPVLRLEDGFLRSVGLGAMRVPPVSWVVDDLGIYYDAASPSRLEALLRETDYDPALLARAACLRERICAAGVTKYNLAGERAWQRPAGAAQVVLVPGQVEGDASLRHGSAGIRRNVELLRAVRQACPQAYVLYKPHPDVVARMRRAGQAEARAWQWCDEVVTDVSLPALLAQVDAVHVMTSLAGFEALLRGRQVVTHGQPFYAGWGLTQDLALPEALKLRRGRPLTLDMLVAAALILYPTYIHPVSGRYTTPESALDALLAERGRLAGRLPRASALQAFLNRWFWFV